ncbi:MAG: NAD+ synthase, partial [Verrucomicrobiota bacterium]
AQTLDARMKIGLAQLNTIVGDLTGNRAKALAAYHALVAQGAELIVFPELVLTGYPPRDLLFKSRFVPDNEDSLAAFAHEVGAVPAVIGYVAPNPAPRGRPFFNAAAWCEGGEVKHVAHKTLLPTYDVFDEDRYFASAGQPTIVEWRGRRIGLTICEDIWTGPVVETSRHYDRDPLGGMEGAPLDLLLNLSASPWHADKDSTRATIVRRAAERVGAPVVYVNAVGGNDELIFDGHSMVMGADGELIAGLAPFAEECRVVELGRKPQVHPAFFRDALADTYDALVLGVRDYLRKSGFERAVIALSGGIDSALTAAIAVSALGPDKVTGVSLPSRISSQHSRDDARALAENLGIAFHTLEIADIVDAAQEALDPLFGDRPPDVTEENIQARSRGMLMMALSNKFGALLLSTGNKSEIAVGYCTLYGDMAGGLAVISDVAKTQVFALCRWLNREREVIPWNTINQPPSAELRPDQKDEDSLPPYEILDGILRLYVEEAQSRAEIVAAGYEQAVVDDIVRKVDLNEYKRKQSAPGFKITVRAFGVGRRIPIVQRYVD